MMKKESANLETSLIKSIEQSEIKGIVSNIGEVALDSITDDGVLKDIPVIGTLTKLYSVGATIKGKIFEKKIIKFLVELENISIEKRKDFVSEISSDNQKSQEIGEHLIIILERIDDIDKPTLIAKLFANYIEEKITYEMFQRLSSIIDKAFLPDLFKLKLYINSQPPYTSWITTSLENLGLVELTVIDGGQYGANETSGGNVYEISDLGKLLLSIIDPSTIDELSDKI